MSNPLTSLLEALIFVSQEPLTLERMKAILEEVSGDDIQAALD